MKKARFSKLSRTAVLVEEKSHFLILCLQWISLFAVIGGLVIATYYFFWPDVVRESQAQMMGATAAPMPDPMDRLTGIVFGLGLALIGAFGVRGSR